MTKIMAVMARTKNDTSRIANAGVETGANMFGISIACCTQIRGSKVQARAKQSVLLGVERALANFSRGLAKNARTKRSRIQSVADVHSPALRAAGKAGYGQAWVYVWIFFTQINAGVLVRGATLT